MNTSRILIYIIIISSIFGACKTEPIPPARDSINILLPADPERINPVYDSKPIGREIYQYISLPVADYHPKTLKLHPILISKIPSLESNEKGFYYDLEIREEASWADGKPILAEDYVFTIKSVLHPKSAPRTWKSFLSKIKSIETFQNKPKSLRVFVDEGYMLSLEIVVTVHLLPKHFYPNNTVLDQLSIEDIKAIDPEAESPDTIENFLTSFNEAQLHSDEMLGNGPYKLVTWETDQYLKLTKQANYWGEKYPDNPFLMANIPNLEFKILGDEMAALTALKDEKLDLVTGLSALNFNDLKNQLPQASYLESPTTRFYYLVINNQNPLLKNSPLRKVLAKLVDVDAMIENIESGYGIKLSGPIHPDSRYYNENLPPDIFNPQQAAKSIEDLGWEDSNGNKTIDKIIDGKLTELELDLLITGSDLSQKIGLVFQQEAEKIGIKINLVPKDIRRMRSENLYNYDFDIAALAESVDLAPIDPFRRWHSDNIKERGSNISGFENEKADALIELIRNSSDPDTREKHYEEFHKVIYEEQPVIFLFSPTQKIVLGKDFNGYPTAKRPGYMANTFTIKPSKK